VEDSNKKRRLNNIRKQIFISILIIFVCLFLSCKQTPEPQTKIDIRWLKDNETSKEEVVKLLGEPPFICNSKFWISWYYPINDSFSQHDIIPATTLNVWFDERGYVREWGFFDPLTQARLEIRESRRQAEKWLKDVSDFVDRVVIADVIKPGVSTKKDVEEGLKYWSTYERKTGHPPLAAPACFESVRVKKSKQMDSELWTYYVMRPSPLYVHVPPCYLIIQFVWENPGIVSSRHFEGYGREPNFLDFLDLLLRWILWKMGISNGYS
jgi:hypothetical protein